MKKIIKKLFIFLLFSSVLISCSVDPEVYQISYELDGGTNKASNPSTYINENLPIILEEPTKEDYEFGGWYTDSHFVNAITQISNENIGNKTLYAKWTINENSYELSKKSENLITNTDNFSLYDSSDNKIADAKINSKTGILTLTPVVADNQIADDYYFAEEDSTIKAKIILRSDRAKIVDKDAVTPMTTANLSSLIDSSSDAELNNIEVFGVTSMFNLFRDINRDLMLIFQIGM